MEAVEYLGFIATAFILASFLLDGNKLRLINSIGAILWFVYGIITMKHNRCTHCYDSIYKPKDSSNGIY
jgi:hypothetical protein